MRHFIENFLPRPVIPAMFRACVIVVLAMTTLAAQSDRSSAAITGVSASPSSIQINTDGTSTVRLRWSVSALNSTPVTIGSAVGDVLDGATVLASPGGALSRSVTTFSPITVQFSETIVISRTLAKSLALGGTITYRRTFGDGGSSVDHFVPIQISNSGQIAYRNVALRFDTGQTFESVGRGASLVAEALVTLSGNGVLDATWQVAHVSGGQPQTFKPLRRVRRAVSGRGKLVLSSPQLPTLSDGIYAVRLMPSGTDTALSDVFPLIRYTVQAGAGGASSLYLNTPAAGAVVVPNTVFSWAPVASADRYRLEFSKPDGGTQTPVAGVDLPANDTRAQIKSFTLSKLRSERASHWRVVAFDAEGAPLATSPYRRLSNGGDQLTKER